MTKTSLAEINEAFDKLNASQVEGKAISTRTLKNVTDNATETIAGFKVVVEEKKTLLLNQHIEKMKRYASERSDLIHQLEGIGVKTLASLPEQAWHTICQQSKLVRLHPTCGSVSFSVDRAREDIKRSADRYGWAMFWGSVFTPGAVLNLVVSQGVHFSDRLFIFAMPSVLAGIMLGMIEGNTDMFKKIAFRIKSRGFEKKYENLLTYLRPGGRHGDNQVQVHLPNAPEDVQRILMKLHGSPLFNTGIQVAAVPQAFGFTPNLRDQLLKHNKERAQQEIDSRMDPIVYVTRNGVTAIVAQFGAFPIEREIINKLVKEEVTEEFYSQK